jgi:hypothetical protein
MSRYYYSSQAAHAHAHPILPAETTKGTIHFPLKKTKHFA